jgi:hypothetical protein
MKVTSTLAYSSTDMITAAKSLIGQALVSSEFFPSLIPIIRLRLGRNFNDSGQCYKTYYSGNKISVL